VTGSRRIALALAATVALAGCGDDEGPQISQAQSSQLRAQLQQIKREVASDPCISDASLTTLEGQVDALPQDLDEDVRQSLEDGVERLRELVDQECADRPEEPEEQQTETEETTPTETTPTETEPPPTETAPPTDTAPEVPEEEDGGLPGGGGDPGSGGIGPGAEKQGKRDRKGRR
jgi:hypothetical protein